ncbi:MAG: Gfo/Idh/MocA family oxidoreductase [Methylococcales bacterium]|nr:Gfo/Idh/MocA family oxidoreductase [Methylococcales bacterium]
MTEKKHIRWGILGAARINQQLMPAIVAANQSQLVAIASQRPGAAAKTLENYAPEQKEVRIYPQRDALLNDETIDAVYIPLDNKSHAEWTLRAIDAGKHVLCEKPIALKTADIEAIERAAKKQNVTVMEGFMYRFHPQHLKVKELIDSGVIGDVRSVRGCFSFMMQPARLYRLAETINNGGGAMWDIGCYAIHTARQPFANHKPLAVTALAKYAESGADMSSSGLIDYGDGRYAHFDFSFERARRAEYEIIGTKGGIKCHNVWAKANEIPTISWWTEHGDLEEEQLPQANHFQLEVEHFVDCILNKKSPALSLADAKINCQIITAALQSAKDGKRINLIT